MKFIFNFLEKHWDRGDRFVITLESMLNICPNCRAYLLYLQDIGKKYGKTIEIKTISNYKAINGTALKEIIN